MALNTSTKPPLNDPPIAKDGQFSQAWAGHLDDMYRTVNVIGVGTTTGDAPNVGYIGETKQTLIASGGAVGLVSGITANVGTLVLPAGNWSVSGSIAFHPTASTSFRSAGGGVTVSSATFPGLGNGAGALIAYSAQIPAADFGFPVGTLPVNSAGSTTVYLVALAAFTASTCTAYGSLRAIRLT